MSFDSFLADLQTSGWPEATCLIAQISLSAFIFSNINRHSKRFPIKQLSPICTLAALASFLLINIISVIARQIEQQNSYYQSEYLSPDDNCGQCRVYHHAGLKFLALIYSALRDFPLMIFALKTVRVSICFIQTENRELPKWAIAIFRNQWRIVAISFLYVLVLLFSNLLEIEGSSDGLTIHSAKMTFQLLCPKQSGVVDWISAIFRYIMLAISYTLSIKSYKELDFKRFIFIIFLLSNTQIIVRAIMVLNNVENTTYHEFYYHSLILNLLGTLLLLPYSQFNLNVNQPPGAAILQNFQAFINYIPGSHILRCYALYKDQIDGGSKYSQCFDACLAVRKIKMQITLQNSLISQRRSEINRLIGKSEVIQQIDVSIRDKITKQTVQLSDIKKLERQLLQFCDHELFKHWKKTESRDYIEKEFKLNMIIDDKMKELGVEIGA